MIEVKLYHQEPLAIEKIEQTFEASFPVKFDSEYWKWRFLTNPNEQKVYVAYIMVDSILAGYYAVSPMQIDYKGEPKKMALSNMTMTHPDHRGKGYFKLLAKTLYDSLKEDGFLGVYGFANHNSHYGFKKYLNWRDLSSLNIFSVSKENFRPLREINSIQFYSEVLTEEILIETQDLKVSSNAFCISRGKENLLWRLVNNPSNTYHCLSGVVDSKTAIRIFYKNYGDEIDVLEVFYSNLEDFNGLIKGFEYLFSLGNTKINLWSNLHSLEHLILEKHGLQETIFNSYFGIIPFTDDPALLDYKNWHYRFLDSDIF